MSEFRKVAGKGEFLSPGVPGVGKRLADERIDESDIKQTKARRTDWNSLNKPSKSRTDVSDIDIDDDISSIDSNNVYSTLPRNSSGNENFRSLRTNKNKNSNIAKQVPPPITVFQPQRNSEFYKKHCSK